MCLFFVYEIYSSSYEKLGVLQVAIEEEDEGSSGEEQKVKSDVNKEKEKEEPKSEKTQPKVVDIEETITDVTMEQKKLDKLRFGFMNFVD